MRRLLPTGIALTLALTACEAPQTSATDVEASPALTAAMDAGAPNPLDAANASLEVAGSDYRIAYVEYYTDPASGQSGNIIIANNRGNKRLSLDFIPDDPRRGGVDGDPNTIDFWIDQTQGATKSGLSTAATSGAIGRAMTTWDKEQCSELNANLVGIGVDIGLVQNILGFGGGPAVSDVMHAGWLPGAFFDFLAPGGSNFILGATFTLTFVSGDLDGDGAADLAAREIYYNDAFSWADDGASDIDVETVALHEAGHGLSQAHFGKIAINPNSGKVTFSPRAVMNASYSGVQRSLSGTDGGGHCGSWGNWPQN